MAHYTVQGRDTEGSAIVQVTVGPIDQESNVIDEMTIVNAVKAAVQANGTGVHSVVARKYEQVITTV
jgi:hypothetical protein